MLTKSTSRRLLFIDDDEDDFFILNEAIREIAADVSIQYIQSYSELAMLETSDFDIIFLDINMPGMNGIECLKRLKAGSFRHIPVVIYSTTKNPAYIEEAYRSGANLFFRKPITFDELTVALRSLLQLNWSKPELITGQYSEEGAYKSF